LLKLARKFGKRESRNVRIELKISHEELAAMVGTTRPGYKLYPEISNTWPYRGEHRTEPVIREKKLTDYLSSIT